MKHQKLEHDEYGRAVVYVAEWKNYYGAGNFCIFANVEDAIFFVVSGLGSDVDWTTFPDPSGKYPYEERNGNEEFPKTPLFRVDREVTEVAAYPRSGRVHGEVRKTSVAGEWIVGNGIAEFSKAAFFEATGKDLVKLEGTGDRLSGRVEEAK